MFKHLFPLLKDKCDSITITMARETDTELRVNLIPRLSHPNPDTEAGLRQPVSLVATPEELDSPVFLETLSRFTASATALADAGAAIEAEHKATLERLKKPKTPDPKPQTPSPRRQTPSPKPKTPTATEHKAALDKAAPEEPETTTPTPDAPTPGGLGI